MSEARHDFARRDVLLVAAATGSVLLALSGRYGYHRDELYFLEAGHHLAWGYPDQPPLVPLLARIMDAIAPGSLVALRLPSTLAAAGVVVLAGLIARELGARRDGQRYAAVATGMSGIVLATGHLLSTATFGILGWVILSYLLLKALHGAATFRLWLAVGVIAGLTLQANPLVATLLVVAPLAIALVGPRELLRSPGPYVAGLIAAVIAAPYLVWQIQHGLPQLDVARNIADGGSGTSNSRGMFLPLQVLLVGPWLAPIWITGLVQLWRRPALRALPLTFAGLCVLFLVVGGKAYYLGGLYPLLLAAGAQPVLDRLRGWRSAGLLVLSLPVLVFALPALPVADAGPIVKANYDVGETIGWPGYVDQIAVAYRSMPPGTVIVTDNYGEAGAVDRYGPDLRLPGAFSGQLGYAAWGPPPASATSVLAVGIDPSLLRRSFSSVEKVGTLHNRWDIDNDEDGVTLYACSGLRRPWAATWKELRRT